jgi:3,4-dihydroxy 2-butanone 4-phosphate synthase/GTP cyclohydrolase II
MVKLFHVKSGEKASDFNLGVLNRPVMKLADYLAREGMSQKDFAGRAGLSTATISLLVRGRVWVSREAAKRIAVATKGKVTAADFVNRETAAE